MVINYWHLTSSELGEGLPIELISQTHFGKRLVELQATCHRLR